jgi:hypothetical protein
MAEANNEQSSAVASCPVSPPLDWEALAKTLNIGSAEEAQKRAWEIANFVGGVENDENSELILKRGGMQVPLKLKK